MSLESKENAKLSSRLPEDFDPGAAMKSRSAEPETDDSEDLPRNLAADAMAASFIEGAFAGRDANTRVFAAQERYGDFSINNGGGAILEVNGLTREEIREQEERDEMDDMAADVAEQQREEHRRAEEWLQASHTLAGQTKTGEEWQAMKKWFDDPENVASWEQAMMAQTGQSLSEVRRTGGKMKRLYELTDLKAQGKELTSEQEAELQTLSNDKEVQTGVQVQQTIAGLDHGVSTPAETAAQISEGRAESVSARSGLIAARANLNAEPLTPTYNAAAANDVMLPKPAQPTPDVAPVEIAAATPQRPVAAMNANLDMG